MQNILFITADQLRHDALGYAGKFPVRTPTIDRLAASGTRFDNAYCASPLCGPSRASIMTGQACYENGVYYNSGSWSRQTPTIASELSDNGYYSVVVGKTHFQPPGFTGGFDKRIGQSSVYPKSESAIRPADIPGEVWTHRSGPPEPDVKTYSITEKVDLAIHEFDLINQRREAGVNGHEPFFMWLSFQRPHSPCVPPEPYFSMYDRNEVPRPIHDPAEVERFPKQVRRWYEGWQCIDPEARHEFRCQYLGDVTLLDEQLDRVMKHLAKLGWDENTLIIISSDHGDYLGDHGMMQKGFFHECSSRVPLIFNGPNIPAGRTVQAPATLAELKPTLMEYTRLAYPSSLDESVRESYTGQPLGEARSLMPAFDATGSGMAEDRMALCETGIHGQGVMLRHLDQKYVYYPQTDEVEWYDLTEDPDELMNIGVGRTLTDLPTAIREKIEQVLKETSRYNDQKYFHDGKVRPMFS